MSDRKPTEQQQRVIDHKQGHALVLAGPGSGKSTTIVERVVRIGRANTQSRIGVVTFSRAAAEDLKKKIRAKGVTIDENQVVVGTFHSLALQRLKETGKFNRSSQILASGAQTELLKSAAVGSGWGGSERCAQSAYEKYSSSWDAALSPEEQRLVKEYYMVTAATDCFDFSVLLRTCVAGFLDGTIPLSPFSELIVDEAQDADELQHQWIRCFERNGTQIILVADDDQAIYRFRHAAGKVGLDDFQRRTEAKMLLLEGNFRSRWEILEYSNALIRNSPNRYRKTSRSMMGSGGRVEAHRFQNQDAELSELIKLVSLSPDSWAVLARSNEKLNRCEHMLARSNIPHWRPPGESIWDSHVGSALLMILRSLNSKQPALLLCRALTLLQLLRSGELPNNVSELSKDFMLIRLADGVRVGPDHNQRANIIRGMSSKWQAWKEDAQKSATRVIMEVGTWVKPHISEKHHKLLDLNLACLCARQGTLWERVRIEGSKKGEKNGVALLTFHASKGLEFSAAWLYGLEEKTHSDLDLPEERRLVYVAMTRAKLRLVISCSEPQKPSRFLEEAGLPIKNYKAEPTKNLGPTIRLGDYGRRPIIIQSPPAGERIPEVLTRAISNMEVTRRKKGMQGNRSQHELEKGETIDRRTSANDVGAGPDRSRYSPGASKSPRKSRRRMRR